MCFGSTLIFNLLLASIALAGPLAHRSDSLQSYTRAGVMIGGNAGTFCAINATITMPDITGNAGDYLSAWVGIDSGHCSSFFHAGVTFTASPSTYTVWHRWFPNPVNFLNTTISAGDDINISIEIDEGGLSGSVTIKNGRYTEAIVTYYESPGSKLCGQSAEWILGDDGLSEGSFSPAYVGEVFFSNAVASDAGGQLYGPLNGDTLEMVDPNGSVVAYVVHRDAASITIDNSGGRQRGL